MYFWLGASFGSRACQFWAIYEGNLKGVDPFLVHTCCKKRKGSETKSEMGRGKNGQSWGPQCRLGKSQHGGVRNLLLKIHGSLKSSGLQDV